MKTILILTLLAVSPSCREEDQVIVETMSDNYVLVLDLSDRLISNSDQTDIDTSIIRTVFEAFEASVMKHMVVKSKDKFSVRIIPQKGSSLPANEFENNLSLDLNNELAANKFKALTLFKQGLTSRLKQLYQQAHLGAKTTDYYGVDIWQYFNDHINSDILDAYNNHVIVITDGYFDFEDPKKGLNSGNKSSTTRLLLPKMIGMNWQQKAEKDSIGILPVKLKCNAMFVIACIQPKPKASDELESQKLSYLWEKWLRESGVQNVFAPIQNSSSGKMRSQIKSLL